jgi:hypothetical protein
MTSIGQRKSAETLQVSEMDEPRVAKGRRS